MLSELWFGFMTGLATVVKFVVFVLGIPILLFVVLNSPFRFLILPFEYLIRWVIVRLTCTPVQAIVTWQNSDPYTVGIFNLLFPWHTGVRYSVDGVEYEVEISPVNTLGSCMCGESVRLYHSRRSPDRAFHIDGMFKAGFLIIGSISFFLYLCSFM